MNRSGRLARQTGMTPARSLSSLSAGLIRLRFVLIVAAVVGIGSERMFWYWASAPLDHLVVTVVYAPAVAGVLWLLTRYEVRDLIGLMLVAPVVGYLVEGVITPVLYSGGPFIPFFPVWFAAWHGGLSFLVLVVGLRHLLVAGAARTVAVGSLAVGVFWGAWSITMTLPENRYDPELVADHGGQLNLLDPFAFALYALWGTAVLVTAHLAMGRGWWLPAVTPSAPTRWLWLVVVGVVVVAWTAVLPWAAPMFVVYLGLQVVALRRWRSIASPSIAGPTVLERLQGPVVGRALVPLALLPLAASITYASLWAAELPELWIRVFMYATIATQTLVGGVAMVVSLRRAFGRSPGPEPGGAQPISSGISALRRST